jgi:hypothetical protein
MTLFSALEDLRNTTLRAISGVLRRLEYLAGLKNREGSYAHWGLAHVHGDSVAEKTMAQAHREHVSRVLSTPIRELVQDVQLSSQTADMAPSLYVERLRRQGVELLPPEPGAGAGRHLNSVLHALSILVKSPRRASRRAAAPPRSPAQPLPPLADIAGREEAPGTRDGVAG